MLLGVDVGGTFTDAVLVADGTLHSAKTPTTPGDQTQGLMAAVAAVLEVAGAAASDVRGFAHGMTVATNALLEGRVARTALVATAGFTDVVELGRQARPELYRLCAASPAPLTPPQRRFGARERTGPGGVLEPLTGLDGLVADVGGARPEAVAVCLLHAYRHPAHELAIGAALRERLGVPVSLSHQVVGTFREYERAATTEVDAALTPVLGRYLRTLRRAATDAGLPRPAIMQSSGGLTDLEHAADHAALTVLSGPAGGAAAAALIAEHCGQPDLICLDMGGTSTDVCLVESGRVRRTSQREVAGRPLALEAVDIHTVGAGGGSIAWADAGAALRVGPRSAGADPGPACYGLGGTEPTLTDAHVVLGTLDGRRPLAGGIRLDAAAAHAAIGSLGARLGLDPHACAAGIVRVAGAELARAVRVMTVERGIDPRGFALLAFGGAGPLHAAALADELGIRRVLVPRACGVLSALGLAAAERRADAARTVLGTGEPPDLDALRAQLRERLGGGEPRFTTSWDVRYRGQSHELRIDGDDDLRERFEAEHERRYGHRDADARIVRVTVRVAARLPGAKLELTGERGASVRGPAVVALPEATLTVPEGWAGATDATGTIILERS